MFNSIVPQILKAKDIKWDNPRYLSVSKENEKVDYILMKSAETFLCSQLDMKANTLKEVYKKAPEIWKQLKDFRLDEASKNPDTTKAFNLNKESLIYLVNDSNEILDICDTMYEENYKQFEKDLEKYILDITTITRTRKFYTEGKNIIKLVCYDAQAQLPEEDYTPVVIIEFCNNKATYKAYTGILIYKTFTFIPALNSYFETDKLSNLITQFNINDALDYAKENAEDLFEKYKSFLNNPIEISARELISLLKKVGYKLELNLDDSLDSIANINDEESNLKIQHFFNTFTFKTSETAYDILSLTELKKMFRYNELTLLDLLSILSKEYLNYEGSKITADILNSIVFNLLDKQNDKKQIESIKNEVIED